MDILSHADFTLAAIKYSIAYLVLGGGFFGATAIFILAKMLGNSSVT